MVHQLRNVADDDTRGQVNVTAALLLVGLVVAGVWVWKRIPPEMQDYIVDYGVPAALGIMLVAMAIWLPIRSLRRRRAVRRQRERLIARFEQETTPAKRLDLAFTLIELNEYELQGLERVAEALSGVFISTLKTAVGDKQHRKRGMAASHLGVLRQQNAVPALLEALEDDHAYVRACAALGLGRMRAVEAKEKLEEKMKDDWDQTVRSRAREALERMA
jgi:HEAT repeats